MILARWLKFLLPAFVLTWAAMAFWHAAKPMPPGTHVTSLTVRLPESDVEFITDSLGHSDVLTRELATIDRAEQMIVVDQSPLAGDVVRHLAARKHARPSLKIVLLTDPANEVFGGNAAAYLNSLEAAGIIVVRVRLDRLRDSIPLYSGLWRLVFGWWSDPFDEVPGRASASAWARMFNFKSDTRQLMVADDGAGGWTSIVASSDLRDAAANNNAGLQVRGPLAHDIAASELQVAGWSTDDDRLPAGPQRGAHGVGSIDARFLTEGAVQSALVDMAAAAGSNDEISICAHQFTDRRLLDAVLGAASRGARLQVLLDSAAPSNRAAAGELIRRGGAHADVHWDPVDRGAVLTKFLIIRHGNDVWMDLGSADFSRRGLGDLNLAASIELRMPARTAAARGANEYFARAWSKAKPYLEYADESDAAYWRYRFGEATGLSLF